MTRHDPVGNNIKQIVRMIPYAVKWKVTLFSAGLFLVVALINLVLHVADTPGISSMLSGVYTALAPMMMMQILMNLAYTGLFQSSAGYRRMQSRLMADGVMVCSALYYSVALLFLLPLMALGLADKTEVIAFLTPLVAATLLIGPFFVVLYKMGIKAYGLTLFLFVGFFSVLPRFLAHTGVEAALYEKLSVLPLPVLLVLPYIAIFISARGIALAAEAVYRRPFGSWYVNMSFRQSR